MTLTHVGLFAGIGAFDLGLGAGYRTMFANDWDLNKVSIYRENHGPGALKAADVAEITAAHIPGRPDLLTAGFPCVDISEAGRGEGINGARSGVFWQAARIIQELRDQGRAPRVVVVENVQALYTGRGGQDFIAVVGALVECGYRWIGAAVVDTIDFTAQSRPRIFVIAADEIPTELDEPGADRPLRAGVVAEGRRRVARGIGDALVLAEAAGPAALRHQVDRRLDGQRRLARSPRERSVDREVVGDLAGRDRRGGRDWRAGRVRRLHENKEARRPAARNQD